MCAKESPRITRSIYDSADCPCTYCYQTRMPAAPLVWRTCLVVLRFAYPCGILKRSAEHKIVDLVLVRGCESSVLEQRLSLDFAKYLLDSGLSKKCVRRRLPWINSNEIVQSRKVLKHGTAHRLPRPDLYRDQTYWPARHAKGFAKWHELPVVQAYQDPQYFDKLDLLQTIHAFAYSW